MANAAQPEISRNQQIYLLWSGIQEIIGPATHWPYLIRRLFWTRNLNHFQRLFVCSFVFVNGLNPVIFDEWMILLRLCRDQAAINHIRSLFTLFEGGCHYRLYSYNVLQGHNEYLDGTIREYVPRNQRQQHGKCTIFLASIKQ